MLPTITKYNPRLLKVNVTQELSTKKHGAEAGAHLGSVYNPHMIKK